MLPSFLFIYLILLSLKCYFFFENQSNFSWNFPHNIFIVIFISSVYGNRSGLGIPWREAFFYLISKYKATKYKGFGEQRIKKIIRGKNWWQGAARGAGGVGCTDSLSDSFGAKPNHPFVHPQPHVAHSARIYVSHLDCVPLHNENPCVQCDMLGFPPLCRDTRQPLFVFVLSKQEKPILLFYESCFMEIEAWIATKVDIKSRQTSLLHSISRFCFVRQRLPADRDSEPKQWRGRCSLISDWFVCCLWHIFAPLICHDCGYVQGSSRNEECIVLYFFHWRKPRGGNV